MSFTRTLLFSAILILITINCKDESDKMNNDISSEENVKEEKTSYYRNGELEVITNAMDFLTADTLMSGWNKIIYKNNSPETHFILFDKLPADSIGVDDINNDLMPPFNDGMAYLMKNQQDSAFSEFGKIPAWFTDVRRYGGTGLISPNKVAESYVNLIPGKYMMECYVKMANGEFHTSHGMWKILTVTDVKSNIQSPDDAIEINISSKSGYSFDATPTLGNQTFKVEFTDQVPYEHFSGHDVNLVRYEANAQIDSLVSWMNWMRPSGLKTPTPEGFTFLGGMNNCEAGASGYFRVNLEKGNYILISETPSADEKGLLTTFSIK